MNFLIISRFTIDEVKATILNKALGPCGFHTKFYKVFWELIKDDLMVMFNEFHDCKLPFIVLTLE